MVHKKSALFIALFAVASMTLIGVPSTLAVAMDGERTGMTDEQKQAVTDRKAALQEKIATMKQERTAKLEAKRLEVCEKRQQKINTIVAHGTEQNKKQLAVFQKIEEKVKQFYITKELSSDGYASALADADAKEAAAVAAIETAAETTFDCATTDAANPGSAIKEAMTSRHAALKEYRTSIKNLILVVKKANSEQKATTPAATNEESEQ
jgi:hypothetical protein